MRYLLSILALLIGLNGVAQKKVPYKIYKANGKKTNYKKLLKKAQKADIVMFGEEHNNPVAHWFELELTKDLYKKSDKPLIIGAEMMETDNQKQVDDYLQGKIDYKTLKKEARLWPNFKTDYKALMDFTKDHKIPFIATNIPRRYASMVFKGGFKVLDTLPDNEKQWIAPLPIKYDPELKSYKSMMQMDHMKHLPKEKLLNFPKAQAVKDATMAYNILKHFKKGSLFIHYEGSFHSNYKEGIVWYLLQEKPDLKILTITVETQENVYKMDEKHKNKADFIIVTDKDFPRSY